MTQADWQPIETAPRDGTRILTYSLEAPELDRISIAFWWRDDWCCNGYPVTHWCPMPEPPHEKAKRDYTLDART